MYISTSFIAILAAASTAHASHPSGISTTASNVKRGIFADFLGSLFKSQAQTQSVECPAVWTEISSTLTEQFLADGQCTDAARAAIRAAFHDCFNGSCDGSLILADECSRNENRGLSRVCGNLGNLADQMDVGVADLIQFAAGTPYLPCLATNSLDIY